VELDSIDGSSRAELHFILYLTKFGAGEPLKNVMQHPS